MKLRLSENLFGFEEPDSTGQYVFRTALEAFIIVSTCYLAWTWGLYTLRISEVVLPLALARVVDISFMFGNSYPIVNAVLISVLALVGFSKMSRWAYSVAFVLLVLQYSARFSQGEIPHSANLIGMALLGFAIGAILFSDDILRSKFGTGFNYFFLGSAYFSSAISKLVATGISWPDGRHLWMWINEKAVDEIARTGALQLNAIQEMALESISVSTFFLAFGLIAELGALLLWYKRTRIFAVWMIFFMHIGIYLTMDITFKLSMLELILLGIPIAHLTDQWIEKKMPPELAVGTGSLSRR